jgi:uncharacterized protein
MSIHFPTRFVWDSAKAKANEAAHGVSFADAVTVFDDDHAITTEDVQSIAEQRYVTLGMSATARLLVVVYTWRGPDTIRLISAWRANSRQRRAYAQGLG